MTVDVHPPQDRAEGQRWNVIGQSVPRLDWYEKVTGTGQYVADVPVPGALIGRVLRSPHPHARLLRVDTSKAARVPGVRAVLTGEDTPKRRWGGMQADLYALAVGTVRYVGDEIAAVAADDEEAADAALDLIEVEYEELPAVLDPIEAMQAGAPLVHEEKGSNVVLHFTIERGDPDAALAAADLVIEETFHSRLQWHTSLETTGTVASFSPRGKLMVWANANGIFGLRDSLAHVLGLRPGDVQVIQTFVGGSFGGRGHDNNALVCALLAMKAGRPVRLINRREEDFIATRPRMPMQLWMRLGFHRDGRISGKEIKVIADNGAYTGLGPPVASVATLRHDNMFTNQDIRAELSVVHTNKIPTGAFRGFGNPSGQWAMQQMIDIGARALGLDPRDVLLRNLIDGNHTSPHGAVIHSCEVKECVRRAAQLIGWDEKRAHQQPNRGLGIAASCMVSGKRSHHYDGSSGIVMVNVDGTVQVLSGEGETGPGSRTVLAQIVAEELGVRYEDVSVSAADTATTTFAFGTHASRSTYIAGNAARDAARRAREQLLEVAAEMLEVSAADLEITDGVVSVMGVPPEVRSLTVGQVATQALYRPGGSPISALGSWDPPSTDLDKEWYGNESGAYNFCAQAVEVEVDPESGQVKVLNMTMASDAGTVIHPVACEGQNEGALAQGLGYAYIEQPQVEGGRVENASLAGYRIPCLADMPPFTQVFVPSYEPTGPFGAKGVGQIGLDPTAPAIANAIYDAVGVRVTQLPISPEKVWQMLLHDE